MDYECGVAAHDKMMEETKTVDTIPAIFCTCRMLMRFTQAVAWTSYLNSAGFDQNNSKAMKWLFYTTLVGASWVFWYLALAPA